MRLVVAILFFNSFFLTIIQAQQIDNSGFENWENNIEAEGWTCSINYQGIDISTAEKSNDAHSGQFAAKLRNKSFITGDIVPGVIQLGQLDIEQMYPVGGIPFTHKPTAFEVYLKYDQQANDSIVIFCYLSKYDSVANQTIELGGAYFTYDNPVEEYTSFVIPVYYIEEGIPDTINIGFAASNFQPHVGSTLWVDDLTLLYGNYLLAPQAEYPENVSTSGFTAKWTGADYTKGYFLDVASDPDFSNFIDEFENLEVGDTNQFFVPINDTAVKKVYYRLKADYDSVYSDYSNTISFDLPYAPVCYQATNVTTKSFNARWNKIPNADYYILDVATDSLFDNYFENYYFYVLDTNFHTVVGLEPETDYFYRVRARYVFSGKSEFSNVVKVTTPPETPDEIIKFFNLPHKLVIYSDSSIYNSEMFMYSIDGKLFWHGFLNERYTEINTPVTELFIINIFKPEGDLIRRKLVIITPY